MKNSNKKSAVLLNIYEYRQKKDAEKLSAVYETISQSVKHVTLSLKHDILLGKQRKSNINT